ncbi:hypothetical protein OIV83_004847 [Microbotryomycetes sp. JL201]|nr:hypothetical protein OIV83_004847 [Microbotryomycetes sp. JL201]
MSLPSSPWSFDRPPARYPGLLVVNSFQRSARASLEAALFKECLSRIDQVDKQNRILLWIQDEWKCRRHIVEWRDKVQSDSAIATSKDLADEEARAIALEELADALDRGTALSFEIPDLAFPDLSQDSPTDCSPHRPIETTSALFYGLDIKSSFSLPLIRKTSKSGRNVLSAPKLDRHGLSPPQLGFCDELPSPVFPSVFENWVDIPVEAVIASPPTRKDSLPLTWPLPVRKSSLPTVPPKAIALLGIKVDTSRLEPAEERSGFKMKTCEDVDPVLDDRPEDCGLDMSFSPPRPRFAFPVTPSISTLSLSHTHAHGFTTSTKGEYSLGDYIVLVILLPYDADETLSLTGSSEPWSFHSALPHRGDTVDRDEPLFSELDLATRHLIAPWIAFETPKRSLTQEPTIPKSCHDEESLIDPFHEQTSSNANLSPKAVGDLARKMSKRQTIETSAAETDWRLSYGRKVKIVKPARIVNCHGDRTGIVSWRAQLVNM